MGGESKGNAASVRVSRKLAGGLRLGDRLVAIKKHDEAPTHIPIPHPNLDFDEFLCPEGAGLDLRALKFIESDGHLFLLEGDSEAVIGRDGGVTLKFVVTNRTLEGYKVSPKDLLEFAEVLEKKLGYSVRIAPARERSERGEQKENHGAS
ncbi:hypothetical protein AKJ43_02180 [candidate division MSBL1 archaeon SCGC-AAA261D19]|uniref:Uncharacterized protein n=1 Tax=candidate division MSBL1 archaeon SCGC-AAA261D19 TaxID=1698273 RepID=A0A133V6Z1_9EURY|nr:hypothetical protein AKJ43_02180 [candidate division MSBL1 archaeon SCGC-AAA261D19]